MQGATCSNGAMAIHTLTVCGSVSYKGHSNMQTGVAKYQTTDLLISGQLAHLSMKISSLLRQYVFSE